MNAKTLIGGSLAAAALLAAAPASADNYLFGYSSSGMQRELVLETTTGEFSISAYDTGWFFQSGYHDAGNDNYIVGECNSCARTGYYNNFFLFDLAGVTGTITGATLTAYNPDYVSGVLSTWSTWDISSALSNVSSSWGDNSATGLSIFNDLQSGTLFGSRQVTNVVDGTPVSITLNANAIASLNAASGSWGIGGTLREGYVIPGQAVPEPGTWAMMIGGFAAIGFAARRRKTRVAFA